MTKSGWLGLGGAIAGVVSTALGIASELLGKKEKIAREKADMRKYVNENFDRVMQERALKASSEK